MKVMKMRRSWTEIKKKGGVTYQMAKKKGLTPKRKKIDSNP